MHSSFYYSHYQKGVYMHYLIAGVILILALFAIRVSNKHGIPALLLFLVLGIAFGLLGLEFNDFEFAAEFAKIALMVIMFYGGFGTNWKMAKPVAREAIVLSSLGVVAHGSYRCFCYYVMGFDLLEGMLIGLSSVQLTTRAFRIFYVRKF